MCALKRCTTMSLYGYFRLKPKPEHIEAVEQSLKNCELLTIHELQKKTGLTITQAKCAISYMVGTEQVLLVSNPPAPHRFKLPD
jgi:hypothetical protein